MTSLNYHKAAYWIEDLAKQNKTIEQELHAMFNSEQNTTLETLKKQLQGRICIHHEDLMILRDGMYFGGIQELQVLFLRDQDYFCEETDNGQEQFFIEQTKSQLTKTIQEDPNQKQCWFKIRTGDGKVVDLVFKLQQSICPKSCQNFIELCKGFNYEGKTQSQKESLIHRVVKGAQIQGGDIVNNKGTGGLSIQGETFESESYELKHEEIGWIGQANQGEHTNASQFQITLRELAFMDQKQVLFGRIAEGQQILSELNTIELVGEKPKENIVVIDCGEGWPQPFEYQKADQNA